MIPNISLTLVYFPTSQLFTFRNENNESLLYLILSSNIKTLIIFMS